MFTRLIMYRIKYTMYNDRHMQSRRRWIWQKKNKYKQKSNSPGNWGTPIFMYFLHVSPFPHDIPTPKKKLFFFFFFRRLKVKKEGKGKKLGPKRATLLDHSVILRGTLLAHCFRWGFSISRSEEGFLVYIWRDVEFLSMVMPESGHRRSHTGVTNIPNYGAAPFTYQGAGRRPWYVKGADP